MSSKSKSRYRGLRYRKKALLDPSIHKYARLVICGHCKKSRWIKASEPASHMCSECQQLTGDKS